MFLVRAALCGLGLGGLNKLHDITEFPQSVLLTPAAIARDVRSVECILTKL